MDDYKITNVSTVTRPDGVVVPSNPVTVVVRPPVCPYCDCCRCDCCCDCCDCDWSCDSCCDGNCCPCDRPENDDSSGGRDRNGCGL